MPQQQPDLSDRWIQHQRQNYKITATWACVFCPDRRIFAQAGSLWEHALAVHGDRLPAEDGEALETFRKKYETDSADKRYGPANMAGRVVRLINGERALAGTRLTT